MNANPNPSAKFTPKSQYQNPKKLSNKTLYYNQFFESENAMPH